MAIDDELVGGAVEDNDIYEVSGASLARLGVGAPELIGGRKRMSNRRYVLGFNTLAAVSGAQQLTGNPTLDFRPDRLVLVDVTANNTVVTSIKSGNIDQSLGGSIPAAAFKPEAQAVSMRGQTVRAPTAIVISVTMAAAGALQGCVFGLADQ
jgi:hypothetical protein